jgi:hypothetical protein
LSAFGPAQFPYRRCFLGCGAAARQQPGTRQHRGIQDVARADVFGRVDARVEIDAVEDALPCGGSNAGPQNDAQLTVEIVRSSLPADIGIISLISALISI